MTIKKLFILSAFLSTSLLSYGQTTASNLKKLDWLTGTWNRTNNRPGQTGIESWTKDASGKIVGKGITMKGTDTAFVEKLSIVARDGNLYYIADVPNNSAPVYFKFTALTANSFVCENAENDFPKKIAYNLATDGNMKAVISGGGKNVDYIFVKAKGK